jgi:hypothetical protein
MNQLQKEQNWKVKCKPKSLEYLVNDQVSEFTLDAEEEFVQRICTDYLVCIPYPKIEDRKSSEVLVNFKSTDYEKIF